jgi:hypothetical protein
MSTKTLATAVAEAMIVVVVEIKFESVDDRPESVVLGVGMTLVMMGCEDAWLVVLRLEYVV